MLEWYVMSVCLLSSSRRTIIISYAVMLPVAGFVADVILWPDVRRADAIRQTWQSQMSAGR